MSEREEADQPLDYDTLAECTLLGSRRRVTVSSDGILGIGMRPPLDVLSVYEQCWHYFSGEEALSALNAWRPLEQPEPPHWHWHPLTGRVRIDGEPSLEYVKGDGSAREQALDALEVVKGDDLVIKEIHERDDSALNKLLPVACCLCFLIITESVLCPHTPKCQVAYVIYCYLNRCVVLRFGGTLFTPTYEVLHRLTGEHSSPEQRKQQKALREMTEISQEMGLYN